MFLSVLFVYLCYDVFMDYRIYREHLWSRYGIPTEEVIMDMQLESLLTFLRTKLIRQQKSVSDTEAQIAALEKVRK